MEHVNFEGVVLVVQINFKIAKKINNWFETKEAFLDNLRYFIFFCVIYEVNKTMKKCVYNFLLILVRKLVLYN